MNLFHYLESRHHSCINLAQFNHVPDVRLLSFPIISAMTNSLLECNISQAAPKLVLLKYLDSLGCKISILPTNSSVYK